MTLESTDFAFQSSRNVLAETLLLTILSCTQVGPMNKWGSGESNPLQVTLIQTSLLSLVAILTIIN